MSSKKKSAKKKAGDVEEMEEAAAAAPAPAAAAPSADHPSADAAAAAAAAPAPAAAAAAAASPAAAAALAPQPAVHIPPPIVHLPRAVPAPLQPSFTNDNTVAEIMAAINNPAILTEMKAWSLTKLSQAKLSSLFANPALTEADTDTLLRIMAPYPSQLMALRQNATIPMPLRRRIANIFVEIAQRTSKRRRASLAPTLRERQRMETRREVIGFPSDICGGTDRNTTLAFLKVFTSINLLGCSSFTKCVLVSSKRESEEYMKLPGLVGVLTIVGYSTASTGEHVRSYCKVGTSWYTAESDKGILQKRRAGPPVWETSHYKSERMVNMIFCYADLSQILQRLPAPFNRLETGDFQGFPTFSQSGRGTCSVDSVSATFLYCNGYRNIMQCAMNVRPNGNPSINDIISQHFTSKFPDQDSIRAALLALQPNGRRVYTMSDEDANLLRTKVARVFREIIGPQTLAPYDPTEPPVTGVNTQVLDLGEQSSVFIKRQGPQGDLLPSNDLLALFIRSPLTTAAIRYTLFSYESTIAGDRNSRGEFFRENTRKFRNKTRGRKDTLRRKYIAKRFEKIQRLRGSPLHSMNPSEKREYRQKVMRAMARGATNENIARGLSSKKRASPGGLQRKQMGLTRRTKFI